MENLKLKKAKKITKLTTVGLGVVSTVTISVSLLSLSLYWNTYYNATGNAKATGEGLVAYAIDNNLNPTGMVIGNGQTNYTSGALWSAQLGQGYSKGYNPSNLAAGENSFIESGSSLQTFEKTKDNDGNFVYTSLGSDAAGILPEVQAAEDKGEPIHNVKVSDSTGELNNDTNGDGFENVFDLVDVAVIPEIKIESNKGPEFEEVYPEHKFSHEEAMVWNEFMYDGLDVNVYASTEAYYELNIPAIGIAFGSTILVGIGLFSLLGMAIFEMQQNKKELTDSKEVTSEKIEEPKKDKESK